MEKTCKGCGFSLPDTAFNWLNETKQIREAKCRKCRAEEKRQWRINRKIKDAAKSIRN